MEDKNKNKKPSLQFTKISFTLNFPSDPFYKGIYSPQKSIPISKQSPIGRVQINKIVPIEYKLNLQKIINLNGSKTNINNYISSIVIPNFKSESCFSSFSCQNINFITKGINFDIKVINFQTGKVNNFCQSSIPISSISIHPKDSSLIAGALYNGFISVWSKDRPLPIWTSDPIYSHNGRVTSLLWKDDYLISGGDDGFIKLWSPLSSDRKNFIHSIELGHPILTLNDGYAGTYDGLVLPFNFPFIPSSNQNYLSYEGHNSPVIQIQQSKINNIFATVAECCLKIWSYNSTCPLFTIVPQDEQFTCGCWSSMRESIFYICSSKGNLFVYDFLVNQKSHVLKEHISDTPITAICCISSGILIGNEGGSLFIMKEGEQMVKLLDGANMNVFKVYLSEAERKARNYEKYILTQKQFHSSN